MKAPLDGIRIVDWTIWQQGPVCTAFLGDLGAEVIKIEERVGGDPGRGMLKIGGFGLEDLPNFYFEACNRNKKAMTLDLKNPEAREIVYKLVAKSDVFVQNFRKGVADRLGLGYETLRGHNPKLIYASASGFGPMGPESESPCYDILGLARSGIMTMFGEPDAPPQHVTGSIADQMGAIGLAYGIMAALLARERHGVGQRVDASQLGSLMMLQGLAVNFNLIMGATLPKISRKEPSNPLWNIYLCQDGQWICLGMVQSDRHWADFCARIGRPELVKDERFSDMNARADNAGELVEILDETFALKPLAEWMRIFRDGKGDLVFTHVNALKDLPDDPQVTANEYISEVAHPNHGKLQMFGTPIRLTETPPRIHRTAPEFGQHTEEILTELLDYSWDDMEGLRDRKVI